METKIHLSPFENELVQNTEWILAKRSVIEKVYQLFGELMGEYKKVLLHTDGIAPGFFKKQNGKISRGENYHGLPYVMMDYPAVFEKTGVFAIRTFFWWGNFFSLTLHLSGIYFQELNLDNALDYLTGNEFSVCINKDQWDHSFGEDNYVPFGLMHDVQKNAIRKGTFLKISKKTGLGDWNNAAEFLEEAFGKMIDLIKISFRYDEAGPLPGLPIKGSDL